MDRRNEPYSYLMDPNSHVAHETEKNTKFTAKNKLANKSDNNHTRLTQENSLYQPCLKSRRSSVGSVTKNETEQNLVTRVQQNPDAKFGIARASHSRWESNNTQEPALLASRWEVIAPQPRGAMSFQVKQRRIDNRELNINANRKDIQKMANVKSGSKIALPDDNSLRQVAREAPLASRKMISKLIEQKPEIKSLYNGGEMILEAICSGDCVTHMDDVTIVGSGSNTKVDDFGEKREHLRSHRCSGKDVQTQTLISGDILPVEELPSHNVRGRKRTEMWQSHTTTLYVRRSLSDTSIRRTKRSERPRTSPPQFVTTKSTEVCKRTTTECCVSPNTPPGCSQILGKTTQVFNCQSLITTTDYQPPQSLATNQLIVPETIKDILKPLDCNSESLTRCTMTRGMALSLAASFLLFLGLVWTGISMSLVTHRIITQYLYPPTPDANQLSLFLRKLYRSVEVIAYWLWYYVLY